MLSRRERWILVLPLALVLLPLFVWPAASGLVFSFTNFAPGVTNLHWVGAANYAAALGDGAFQASWRNVVVLSAIAVPLELGIGFLLAYLIREPFRGRGVVRVALLAPWLVSPVASGVMWYFLFNLQFGLLNFFEAAFGVTQLPSPLGLTSLALPTAIAVTVWRNAPFAAFLLLPGLLAIPTVDWEVAALDGASVPQKIRLVAIPALRPLLLAVGLLLAGDALGAFDTLLILTGGGPGAATLTPALYSYQQAFQIYYWPLGIASAWLIVLSVVLVGAAYLWIVRREAA